MRMKAALIRLGIRGFKPELLKAPQRLEALRTPEEIPIPPNMLAEMRRDMARLAWVREQIGDRFEQAWLDRLEHALRPTVRHAMVRLLARVVRRQGSRPPTCCGAGSPVSKLAGDQ